MTRILFTVVAIVLVGAAHAHSDKPHAKKSARPISTEETAFGREGDPKKASRTINVDMSDRMRFTPSELTIKRGETVRFRVRNSGQVMHEMVLGTMDELKKHAELMKKHPGMEHDEPYMAHVAPGKTETLTWQFTKAGEFFYGCLVPGHFEAGMIGKVIVVSDSASKGDPDKRQPAKPAAGPAAEMADGEVRRVDRDGQKITIRHGPIPSLDMDQPMTMVFRVRDPAVLERLKPGDKVRFQAEKIDGGYTVTRIEPAR